MDKYSSLKESNIDMIIPIATCSPSRFFAQVICVQQTLLRNKIQHVLHQFCFRFMSHISLFVVTYMYNNLGFISKYPFALFPELSNISSHDTFLHALFYSFHSLPLQASLQILIFNNFRTKSMVPIVLDLHH